jgi:hypothetical protein
MSICFYPPGSRPEDDPTPTGMVAHTQEQIEILRSSGWIAGDVHQMPIQPYQPQQENVLDQFGKVLSLQMLMGQRQTQQLQNQQLQMQVQDQQKLRQIMSDPSIDWSKPDALGQMMSKGAQAGISPQTLCSTKGCRGSWGKSRSGGTRRRYWRARCWLWRCKAFFYQAAFTFG